MNVLPTNANLKAKNICNSDLGCVCQTEVETLLHVVRDCRFAQDVFISYQLQCVFHCPGVVPKYFDSFRSNEFANTLMLCWHLWDNQNDILHNNRCSTAQDIAKCASKMLLAFVAVNMSLSKPKESLGVKVR